MSLKVLGKIPVFIGFGLCLVLMACPKFDFDTQPKKLPPVTQTGANTFGCKINGILYFTNPDLYCQVCWPLTIRYDTNQAIMLYIRGNDFGKRNKYAQLLEITLSKCLNSGTYKLGNKDKGDYAMISPGNGHEYYTNTMDSSSITISRLDPINKIVSGTFDFSVRDSTYSLIRITDGIFDVKYPYPK